MCARLRAPPPRARARISQVHPAARTTGVQARAVPGLRARSSARASLPQPRGRGRRGRRGRRGSARACGRASARSSGAASRSTRSSGHGGARGARTSRGYKTRGASVAAAPRSRRGARRAAARRRRRRPAAARGRRVRKRHSRRTLLETGLMRIECWERRRRRVGRRDAVVRPLDSDLAHFPAREPRAAGNEAQAFERAPPSPGTFCASASRAQPPRARGLDHARPRAARRGPGADSLDSADGARPRFATRQDTLDADDTPPGLRRLCGDSRPQRPARAAAARGILNIVVRSSARASMRCVQARARARASSRGGSLDLSSSRASTSCTSSCATSACSSGVTPRRRRSGSVPHAAAATAASQMTLHFRVQARAGSEIARGPRRTLGLYPAARATRRPRARPARARAPRRRWSRHPRPSRPTCSGTTWRTRTSRSPRAASSRSS